MSDEPRRRIIIILYDGTWCGRQTDTRSNIHLLAEMMEVNMELPQPSYTSPPDAQIDIRARYFDGVGLNGGFLNYLWNGAFATRARDECRDVYRFIVQNFAWDDDVHTEVWMFGISRGAYIVRSVAGLINNCGIIRDTTNTGLIDQAYDLYRNPQLVHHPSSPEMKAFRTQVSYDLRTPIKFMGIFDTVGSRGIPRLNYHTGAGFEWPEFYDDRVSTVVEKVYHAVAIHDRFWAFQPCLASRDPKHTEDSTLANLMIRHTWFPGCHYDLARQKFQFFREGGGWLERFSFPILNIFNKTVSPNHKLADLVLIWMLEGIETEGGGAFIRFDINGELLPPPGPLPPPPIQEAIGRIKQRLVNQSLTGTGDVYGDTSSYLPGGRIISLLLRWLRRLDETAYAILFRPVDRMIPDHGIGNPTPNIWNQVYRYITPDVDPPGEAAIETIAEVNAKRYPSQTCQNFIAYMDAVQRDPWA